MTDLHTLPADNRMAFIGASTGIPDVVQQRLDTATSRLNTLGTDTETASLDLPRFSVLFSSTAFQCMREPDANCGTNINKNTDTDTDTDTEKKENCHRMGEFFGQIGALGHALNTAKLADCQFLVYDAENGDIAQVPLADATGCIQCHWQDHEGTLTRQTHPTAQTRPERAPDADPQAPALAAHHRIHHIHEQLATQTHLHHPDLLVSDNTDDVKAALLQGTPAILVSAQAKGKSAENLPTTESTSLEVSSAAPTPLASLLTNTSDTSPLLIALDFDCTLAGGQGDWLYNDLMSHLPHANRINHFHRFEQTRSNNLLGAGPALTFVQALVGMKKLLALMPTPMDHRLAFAIVTARGKAAKDRVHHNLATYLPDYQTTLGLQDVAETSPEAKEPRAKTPGLYYMNGAPKLPRLAALQTDLYLDDSKQHAEAARDTVPTGEILWGPTHDGQRVFQAHPALTGAPNTEHALVPYVIIPEPPETQSTTSHTH